MNELKRITTPFKYTKTIEKLYEDKKNANLIIACSNKRKNFYDTTKYSQWNEMYLASLSWRNQSKSTGDHFTINPISKLPAWTNNKINFNDMDLQPKLITTISKLGIQKPTNIQSLSIPIIINGNNTIIGGETGCGKTLAFVLPILNKLLSKTELPDDEGSPFSLIVAPTWELCNQLHNVIKSITEPLNLTSILFKQRKDLEGNVNLMVSTPHNMLDALKCGDIHLKNLSSIVLDEADMLLDESFSVTVQNILSRLSIQTERTVSGESVGTQVILSNATAPNDLERAFGNILPIDSFVIAHTDHMQRLIPTISHKFIRCEKEQKPALLIKYLKMKGLNSSPCTIVFCNTNESVLELSNILTENKIEHGLLNKTISMEVRQKNFARFQNGEIKVLLATDLGSRGLDTVMTKHVINYEFPRFISDYIHRAGRTGRVGCAAGHATSFISSKHEVSAVQYIETSVRQNMSLEALDSRLRQQSSGSNMYDD